MKCIIYTLHVLSPRTYTKNVRIRSDCLLCSVFLEDIFNFFILKCYGWFPKQLKFYLPIFSFIFTVFVSCNNHIPHHCKALNCLICTKCCLKNCSPTHHPLEGLMVDYVAVQQHVRVNNADVASCLCTDCQVEADRTCHLRETCSLFHELSVLCQIGIHVQGYSLQFTVLLLSCATMII